MSSAVLDAPVSAAQSPTLLPNLDSDYPLTPEQIAFYQDKGYILLRGVASADEAAAYRTIITDITNEFAKSYKPMSERDTYGKAFIQLGNIWEKNDAVKKYVVARRFAKIAAELMGVDGVRLYHDQALYKEPGGGFTPWHQDQQYWPLDGVKCVTLWMPLVDASEDMGTMRFAAGSQQLGYLGHMNISDDSEIHLSNLVKERGYEIQSVGAMRAGDATFHNGWTIHGAPGNSSPINTREVMTIIYLEEGAIISEPDSDSRRHDLAYCFPDLKPGDLAAGRLNPLLYHKEKRP